MKSGKNNFMNAEEFVNFITPYLPIQYKRKANNYYQNYLLENLRLCWENKKYQFVLLTANILFMTIVFKDFWFDDKLMGKTVALDKQLPISYYKTAVDYFGLSKYNEKIFLKSYLKHLSFDDNEIKDILHLIDYRDHCAHACGKIYYNQQKVSGFLDQYAEVIKSISKVREEETKINIKKNYAEYITSTGEIKYFIEKLLYVYNLSYNELAYVNKMFKLENTINFQEKAYQILAVYYIDAIIGDFYNISDYEEHFESELDALINFNEEKKEEIADIIEKDLGSAALNSFSFINYESIKKIIYNERSGISSDQFSQLCTFDFESYFKNKSPEDVMDLLAYLKEKFGGEQ